MLVLSRKTEESILIDGRIRLTVVAIRGNIVRLGIEAPPEVGSTRAGLAAGLGGDPVGRRVVDVLALAESERVDRHAQSAGLVDRDVERQHAVLVLAVRERKHGPAARLAFEELEGLLDRVEEPRAADRA